MIKKLFFVSDRVAEDAQIAVDNPLCAVKIKPLTINSMQTLDDHSRSDEKTKNAKHKGQPSKHQILAYILTIRALVFSMKDYLIFNLKGILCSRCKTVRTVNR
jgi:hypothetical protein